jgi:uncharacterized protein (DUF2235 family)
MKNIVICCDGTSNDFGHENSNVVKLYSVLEKNTAEQTVYYDPGVGTPSTYDAFNPITRQVKHYFGKCFGYGLSDNIMEAYAFLMMIPEAMRLYHDRNLKSVADEFKETFARKCPIHFLGLWDTVSFVGWIYNPVALQATANNKSVKNVRHAISIDERRAFFRQNLWGNRYQTTQDVKQVWFAGVHSDVGGSYPPAESALSNIALEWMLVEAREKELKIGEEQKAKEMVNQIPEPHLKAQHNSLTGCWPIAECWPKIVRIRKAVTDGQSKWVSRPYFNLGRPRFLSTGHEITLHESVLLRLQGRQDYRPKNLMKICSDIDAIPTHFYIEKWKRL